MTKKITLTILTGLLMLCLPNFSFAQYCIPTTNCTDGDGLINFEIGTFSNPSGCGSDLDSLGYSDFTALPGLDLAQGVPYTATFTSGFGSQQVSAWIDADNSQTFDAIELVLMDFPAGTVPAGAEITIPASLPIGSYTMRLQSAYNTPSSDDPCTMPNFGETEDYTVNVVAPPSCIPISGLMSPSASATEVTLSWTDNAGAAAWDIELVQAGGTPTGVPNSAYNDITNPVTVSGLNALTSYDFYVRADCSTDDANVSDWSGPITVTTACSSFAPPYYEAFDAPEVFGTLPDCWEQANAGTPTDGPMEFGSSTWGQDGLGNVGTSGAYRINLFTNTRSDWFITPEFDLTTGGPYQVEFDFAIVQYANQNATNLGSDDEVQFLVSTDAGLSWSALQVWTAADNVDPAGEKIIFDLAAYAGQTIKFAFYGTEGEVDDAEDNDISFDNFYVRTPPNCVDISGLTTGALTANTAEISWTENGSATLYDVEYVLAGEEPTGTPTLNDVSNPVTIMGLSATTEYDVYVRADCGGDDTDVSLYAGPITFVTECDVYAPPYLESFEDFVPECWSEASSGLPADGPMEPGAGSWAADGFGNVGNSGAARINIYSDFIEDWLLSPTFNLAGGNFQAEFDFALTQFANTNPSVLGSDDEVQFLISVDNGASWTAIQTWTAADNIPAEGQKLVYDLTAYADMNVKFAFFGTSGSVVDPEDNDIFVDNFYVRLPPTCVEVSGVAVTEVTSSSAVVSWTENGDATLYDVEIVAAGEMPTGTPTSAEVSNPLSLTDLTAVTSYDVYVRANCGAGDVSIFVGPISFTTACDSYLPDYIEDFTAGEIECWDEANSGDLSTGPMELGGGSWAQDGFANDGNVDAYRINIYSTFLSDWLLTPTIDLTASAAAQVEFDIALTNFATTDPGTLGSDDRIYFLVTADNGVTWANLDLWGSTTPVSNTGEHKVYDLAAYVGSEVRFAFYANDGEVNDAEDVDFFIDNFEVNAPVVPLTATATGTAAVCGDEATGSASATAEGGMSPYSYVWSNGEETQEITSLVPGTYSCVITDAAENAVTVEYSVAAGAVVTGAGTSTDETTLGSNDGAIDYTPAGGTAPYSFDWDNGSDTEDLTGLAPGVYCVISTDSNGCSSEESCFTIVEGTSAVNQITDLTKLMVAPNPVGNQSVNLNASFASAKNLTISLISSTGQVLQTVSFAATQEVNTQFDMSKYPASLYVLRLTDTDTQDVLVRRVVKK